jgi:hypothetical protein
MTRGRERVRERERERERESERERERERDRERLDAINRPFASRAITHQHKRELNYTQTENDNIY